MKELLKYIETRITSAEYAHEEMEDLRDEFETNKIPPLLETRVVQLSTEVSVLYEIQHKIEELLEADK